jgi:hypothetical protein
MDIHFNLKYFPTSVLNNIRKIIGEFTQYFMCSVICFAMKGIYTLYTITTKVCESGVSRYASDIDFPCHSRAALEMRDFTYNKMVLHLTTIKMSGRT